MPFSRMIGNNFTHQRENQWPEQFSFCTLQPGTTFGVWHLACFQMFEDSATQSG